MNFPSKFSRTSLKVGQIASHCQVNRRTVQRWIKEEKLKGLALPSGHFRVSLSDFRTFLVNYGFPLVSEVFDFSQRSVLIMDADDQRFKTLTSLFQKMETEIQIRRATTWIEACLYTGCDKPDFLFIALENQEDKSREFLERMDKFDVLKETIIFWIVDASVTTLPSKNLPRVKGALEFPVKPSEFDRLLENFL